MEVNYQQIGYMTLIGVHLTMHLVCPNYCHVSTILWGDRVAFLKYLVISLASMEKLCM